MSTETIAQPKTALITIRSQSAEYQLQNEAGLPCASLRVGWPVRRGEIRTEHGVWSVRRDGCTVRRDGCGVELAGKVQSWSSPAKWQS
jgi:hypothetical protein